MQYLFDAWDDVSRSLTKADHVLLLSDYDGTFTPIVDRPELAVLPEETTKLLRKLVKNRRYTIGIISGRALTDLKEMVGVDGIIYAGNHGLEFEGFGTNFLEPLAEELRPFLKMLSQILTITLRGIKGAFVENKGLTLSVHYRCVDESEEQKLKYIFDKVTNSLNVTGRIKITRGKKVHEIRPPVDWNKGKAISWLIAKCRETQKKDKLLPIYLGDDLTDEDAFSVVEAQGGITIFVGEEQTKSMARYYLCSPDEVVELLKML